MQRPHSPPGLPRGPFNMLQPQRSQVKAPIPSQTAAPNDPTTSQPAAMQNASSLAAQPGLVNQQSADSGGGGFADQQGMFRASQHSMVPTSPPSSAGSGEQKLLSRQGSGMTSGSQQGKVALGQPHMQGPPQQAMLGLKVPSMQGAAQHGRLGYPQPGMLGYSQQAMPASGLSSQQSAQQSMQQSMQVPGQQSIQGQSVHSMQGPMQQSVSQPGMLMRPQQGMPDSAQANMLSHPGMHMLGQQGMRMMQPSMHAMQQSSAWQQQAFGRSQQMPSNQSQAAVLQGTSPRVHSDSGAAPKQPISSSSPKAAPGTGGMGSNPRADPTTGTVANSPRAPSGSGAVASSPRAQPGSGSIPESPMAGNSPSVRSSAGMSGSGHESAWQVGAAGQLPGAVTRPNSAQQPGTAEYVRWRTQVPVGSSLPQHLSTTVEHALSARVTNSDDADGAMPQQPNGSVGGPLPAQQTGPRAQSGPSPGPAGASTQAQQPVTASVVSTVPDLQSGVGVTPRQQAVSTTEVMSQQQPGTAAGTLPVLPFGSGLMPLVPHRQAGPAASPMLQQQLGQIGQHSGGGGDVQSGPGSNGNAYSQHILPGMTLNIALRPLLHDLA